MASGEWSDTDVGGLPSIVVAAHELKAPLALIRQLTLLLDDLGDEAKAGYIRKQIVQTSDQALQLANDLANVGNLSPTLFPLEPVNPLSVCRQIALEMKPMISLYNRQISWPKINRPHSSKLILANRKLLERILINFLYNAMKYTEQDTKIAVKMMQYQDKVRISVRDFGPMMSLREYRQLLNEMEMRKTVRTRPESSGLGIYVANQFAHAMCGQIGLIRHRDGLTFYVDLPISHQMSLL